MRSLGSVGCGPFRCLSIPYPSLDSNSFGKLEKYYKPARNSFWGKIYTLIQGDNLKRATIGNSQAIIFYGKRWTSRHFYANLKILNQFNKNRPGYSNFKLYYGNPRLLWCSWIVRKLLKTFFLPKFC